MKGRLHFCELVVWGIFLLGRMTVLAQNPAPGQTWVYRLLEGSLLTQDSLTGGPPTIIRPLRGTFELRLLNENPLYSTYLLTNISWVTPGDPNLAYQVTGKGTYQVGGEVAYVQSLQLETLLKSPSGQVPKSFTNQAGLAPRQWPVLEVELAQTDNNLVVFYRLHLRAAPVREIWFSTVSGLTAGIQNPPSNHYSGGDLLSLDGRVVKRNADLAGRLWSMPPVPDLGLAAVDLASGGEILFALDQGVFSERLGPIQQGDLLSNRGRIVKRNQELLAAFGLGSRAGDSGLDAVHARAKGDIYFSIRTNVFSSTLGVTLSRGDLLSDQGRMVKSNKQLLARFQPVDSAKDYGLDALYMWPSGEVWFSTEEGFTDQQLGPVGPGDLLSDDGYIVYRNLEMVGAFQPLEDVSSFGLDALFVVSDVSAPSPAPRLVKALPNFLTGDWGLFWEGTGQVFQVEKAENAEGPYSSVGSISPDQEFSDGAALWSKPRAFYRVRQW